MARIPPFRRALLRPALALALAWGLAAPALSAAETLPETAPGAPVPGSGAATDPVPAPEPHGTPAPNPTAEPTSTPTAEPIPANSAAAPGPEPRPAALAEPEGVDPAVAARLFAEPEVADQTRNALALLEAGDTAEAAALFDQMIARHPGMGLLHARRAAVALLLEDPDRARAEIRAAAEAGLPDLAGVLADPLFAPIAGDAICRRWPPGPNREPDRTPSPPLNPPRSATQRPWSPPPTPPGIRRPSACVRASPFRPGPGGRCWAPGPRPPPATC